MFRRCVYNLNITTLYCRQLKQNFVQQVNCSKMIILNVAEKNDAAKNIAALLSNGTSRKREGFSVYNKIYEFDFELFNRDCRMIMTSVAGHLLGYEFTSNYRGWSSCDPLSLFDAPVVKQCPQDLKKIQKTLENEVRSCSKLIIWTDCDREGENIGFEIIQVCRNIKPNIEILRAKFSEITRQSVHRAINNLIPPDKNVSDAVDVRQELDLRIGAAFTRFQTLHLKRTFPQALAENLISYGSCQFPTLGFVVERYKAISDFIPEPFWKIKVTDTKNELTVEFLWKRVRLFNELACKVLFDTCIENPMAKVEKVQSKPKTKWRPKPLDTVEMEKTVSRKLRINAKETMRLAEKLYTQGIISYPRTETNIFPKDINLSSLVEKQVPNSEWGEFAQRVLQDGPNPFQGNKSDQAHPPIHPTKYAPDLTGQEKRLYEFIVRHFLACLSKHAEGLETTVDIDIAGEKFTAKGLMIIARNYLDVYPYDKWNAKEIHIYQVGDTFIPSIEVVDGETNPPDLLTEADLIALMDKHGIGTDATHAEHIETIKARLYVGLKDDRYFVPKTLGMGLVEGYDNMGFEMSKPHLRAGLENDLKRICEGVKRPENVLRDQIRKYKETFEEAQRQVKRLDEAIELYLQVQPSTNSEANAPTYPAPVQRVKPCSKCGQFLSLRTRREGGMFIGCEGYPGCKEAIWLPPSVLNVSVTSDSCTICGPSTHLLDLKFSPGSTFLPTSYRGCIGGCDVTLLDVLNPPSTRMAPSSQNSQFGSRPNVLSGPPPSTTGRDSGFQSGSSARTDSTPGSVFCNCGKPAVCLTVRKAGPNQGRQFYKCDVPQGSSGCNFFQWADNIEQSSSSNSAPPRPPFPGPQIHINGGESSNNDGSDNTNCYCAMSAIRLTVQKDGPNKGRCFMSCSKQRGDSSRCDFFQWCDNNESTNSQSNRNSYPVFNSNRSNRGRGRGGNTSRQSSSGPSGPSKKRKCGLCGEEGKQFSSYNCINVITGKIAVRDEHQFDPASRLPATKKSGH